MAKAKKRDRGEWKSPTNEARKRPMITLTLTPEGAEAIQKLADRLEFSRSVVVQACAFEQADAIRSPSVFARLKSRCETLESPNGRRGRTAKK